LSIYHSFIFRIFDIDYGRVVHDNYSQSVALLLDTSQETAARIITGCLKDTANDAVLKEVCFVRLSSRSKTQILLYYYKVMFGMSLSTLQPLTSKTFEDLAFNPHLKND